MKQKIVTALIVFMMYGSCPALALTDYSTQLDYQDIQAVFRAGLISREDQVISSLKSCLRPPISHGGAKSVANVGAGRDLTMLLKQARDYYSTFSEEGQAYVDRLLLRPTSSTNTWPFPPPSDFFSLPSSVQVFAPSNVDYPNIGGKYKFWYVVGESVPDDTHNTTLEFVESVAAAFETSYAMEVGTMGYTEPLQDTGLPDNEGDGAIDVYLMNCGAYGIYGYTAPLDANLSSSYASYMVIDNDFTEFVTSTMTALDAMEVTVAHEFNHSIQFAINVGADDWIMEATSTWMESQVYPDIHDNIQYLNGAYGFFANTDVPIDDDYQWYNNWIWLEYMSLKWGQDSVLNVWGYIGNQFNSKVAVSNEIIDNGSDLETAFTEFALKNYSQTDFYPDAADYDEVTLVDEPGLTLDYRNASSHLIATGNIYVQHLSAVYYGVSPGAVITPGADDTLLIQVARKVGSPLNGVVSVRLPDNSVTEYPLTFDSSGNASFSLSDFNQSQVTEAVVVLINYSADSTSDLSYFRISGGLPAPIVNGSSSGGCFIESSF